MTGEVHGSNGSRSSEHSNVASATLDSKWIVASELWTSPPVAGSPSVPGVKPGPAVKIVATPSSRHVYIAGWPTLPSKSIARTKNMCGPTSVSSSPHSKPPWFMCATVSKPQFSHALRSTLHSNVTSGSLEWNVNSDSSAHVSASGFMSMNASRRDVRRQRPVLPRVPRGRVVGQLAEVDRADLERVQARAEVRDLVRVLAVLPRLVVGGVEAALEDEVHERRAIRRGRCR